MNINYANIITQFLMQCIYLTRLNAKPYNMYIQGMYSEMLCKKNQSKAASSKQPT